MRSSLPQSAVPLGYCFSAASCGLKKRGKLDLGMISSGSPASAAAVFTTNLVQAAPLVLSREHLRASRGTMRGVVVNSGNANCSTGPDGLRASRRTAAHAAREMGSLTEEIFVCSTGVIGVPLRVEKILRALPELAAAQRASASSFAAFTRAILTTDTRPKWAAARCRIGARNVRLLGCAKGAGMIHPQMAPPAAHKTATMLAFVVTDAAIAPRLLQKLLAGIADRTFNAITVDGDTSTNDTLLAMANGASGCRAINAASRDLRRFSAALEEVCGSLALQIVADGEGAKRVVEIEVRGGRSEPGALQIARTIATSSLVKTALAGGDPNWGRILAAAGRAGVPFDPERVDIAMAGIPVYRRGRALPFDERAAHKKLLAKRITIVTDLRQGRALARYWTCDFTGDYVRINASYRT